MLPHQILGALPAGRDSFLYMVPSLSVLNINDTENVTLTFSLLRTLVSGRSRVRGGEGGGLKGENVGSWRREERLGSGERIGEERDFRRIGTGRDWGEGLGNQGERGEGERRGKNEGRSGNYMTSVILHCQ